MLSDGRATAGYGADATPALADLKQSGVLVVAVGVGTEVGRSLSLVTMMPPHHDAVVLAGVLVSPRWVAGAVRLWSPPRVGRSPAAAKVARGGGS